METELNSMRKGEYIQRERKFNKLKEKKMWKQVETRGKGKRGKELSKPDDYWNMNICRAINRCCKLSKVVSEGNYCFLVLGILRFGSKIVGNDDSIINESSLMKVLDKVFSRE